MNYSLFLRVQCPEVRAPGGRAPFAPAARPATRGRKRSAGPSALLALLLLLRSLREAALEDYPDEVVRLAKRGAIELHLAGRVIGLRGKVACPIRIVIDILADAFHGGLARPHSQAVQQQAQDVLEAHLEAGVREDG